MNNKCNLRTTIELYGGGSGSGCNPAVAKPKCGRPSKGGKKGGKRGGGTVKRKARDPGEYIVDLEEIVDDLDGDMVLLESKGKDISRLEELHEEASSGISKFEGIKRWTPAKHKDLINTVLRIKRLYRRR